MKEQGLIAVGVDDEGQIWTAHFGMATWCHLINRQGEVVARRSNTYAQADEHHGDPVRIAALLPECDVFIARRMGGRSRRRLAESLGIEPVLTAATDPDQAVQAYLEGQGD